MLLEKLALKKILEVVTHHADLLIRVLCNIGAAPQQTTKAFFSGGVAFFFPKLHLPGPVVQNDRLTDGNKISNGVYLLPHLHGNLLVANVYGNRNALKGYIQVQPHGFTAPQIFVHRLDARPLVYAHRRQNVIRPQARIPDANHRQVLRRQIAVIGAHGGGGQNHQITRLQPTG